MPTEPTIISFTLLVQHDLHYVSCYHLTQGQNSKKILFYREYDGRGGWSCYNQISRSQKYEKLTKIRCLFCTPNLFVNPLQLPPLRQRRPMAKSTGAGARRLGLNTGSVTANGLPTSVPLWDVVETHWNSVWHKVSTRLRLAVCDKMGSPSPQTTKFIPFLPGPECISSGHHSSWVCII